MNSNDPVYPTIETVNHGNHITETRTDDYGISLRTHIAAMAMQGMISNYHIGGNGISYSEISERSVLQADALIEELQKQTK